MTKSESITFRISPEMKAKLQEVAGERKLSEYLEGLVERHLKALDRKNRRGKAGSRAR